jgi:hypothetical protein
MQAVTKRRLGGSPLLTQGANQKEDLIDRVWQPAPRLTADPPSMGVPLGWLFSRKLTSLCGV